MSYLPETLKEQEEYLFVAFQRLVAEVEEIQTFFAPEDMGGSRDRYDWDEVHAATFLQAAIEAVTVGRRISKVRSLPEFGKLEFVVANLFRKPSEFEGIVKLVEEAQSPLGSVDEIVQSPALRAFMTRPYFTLSLGDIRNLSQSIYSAFD